MASWLGLATLHPVRTSCHMRLWPSFYCCRWLTKHVLLLILPSAMSGAGRRLTPELTLWFRERRCETDQGGGGREKRRQIGAGVLEDGEAEDPAEDEQAGGDGHLAGPCLFSPLHHRHLQQEQRGIELLCIYERKKFKLKEAKIIISTNDKKIKKLRKPKKTLVYNLNIYSLENRSQSHAILGYLEVR